MTLSTDPAPGGRSAGGRNLLRLPEKAAGAVLETLDAIAANPRPAGKPLQFALGGVDGRFAGGPTGVVYRLDEEDQP